MQIYNGMYLYMFFTVSRFMANIEPSGGWWYCGLVVTNHMDLLCNFTIYLTAASAVVRLIISIHNKFAMNIPLVCYIDWATVIITWYTRRRCWIRYCRAGWINYKWLEEIAKERFQAKHKIVKKQRNCKKFVKKSFWKGADDWLLYKSIDKNSILVPVFCWPSKRQPSPSGSKDNDRVAPIKPLKWHLWNPLSGAW